MKQKRKAQERPAMEEEAKAELARQAEEVGNVFTRSHAIPLASEHSSSVAQELDAELQLLNCVPGVKERSNLSNSFGWCCRGGRRRWRS